MISGGCIVDRKQNWATNNFFLYFKLTKVLAIELVTKKKSKGISKSMPLFLIWAVTYGAGAKSQSTKWCCRSTSMSLLRVNFVLLSIHSFSEMKSKITA